MNRVDRVEKFIIICGLEREGRGKPGCAEKDPSDTVYGGNIFIVLKVIAKPDPDEKDRSGKNRIWKNRNI